ncbi:hypothetical protein N7470_004320 [Penicillium chermesinum]|nr:hypothetical protein N7470_004320 [Penicillium chermesinum]
MPVLTLHLLALHPNTDAQVFLSKLKQSPHTKVIVASQPRHVVIHPTILDNSPLATQKWDLMVLLQNSDPATKDPIPASLRTSIQNSYDITTGIPSKLLSSYPTRDATLKRETASTPLTGALDKLLKNGSKDSSQNLEVSPQLLQFMTELSKSHTGPVTMLNLLHFQQPDGKKSYYQYGQAFMPKDDSRGSRERAPQDWWNEISIVHYPSIRHFCDMLAGEDYQAINEKYRLGALRDTFLLCTTEFEAEDVANAKL